MQQYLHDKQNLVDTIRSFITNRRQFIGYIYEEQRKQTSREDIFTFLMHCIVLFRISFISCSLFEIAFSIRIGLGGV